MSILRLLAQIKIDPSELDIPKTGQPNDSTISNILTIVIGTVGVVAVLVIIVAGLQFIASRGDPQKSNTARNAVIYASVGLVIVIISFSIVKFVLGSL